MRRQWKSVVAGIYLAAMLIPVFAEAANVGDVLRVTSKDERGKTLYYLNNGFSKDGRMLAYFRNLKTGPRLGFRSTSIADSFPAIGVSFAGYPWQSSGPEEGAWTPDSRRYYLNFGTYYVDFPSGRLGRLVADDEFYWPALSPDGSRVCGINKRTDQEKKTPVVRCYGLGEGKATTVQPPFLDNQMDVSFGFVGNSHLWFRTGKKRVLIPVVNVETGRQDGYLNVFREGGAQKPMKFYHVNLSPEAIALGAEGDGFIVGHTPGVYKANANFHATSPEDRQLQRIGAKPRKGGPFVPVGNHMAISPDERMLLVENVLGRMGTIAAYDIEKGEKAEPRWLTMFRPLSSYDESNEKTWRPYPMPQWSPDGTKVAFTSSALQGDGIPYLYLYIFKLPDAPHLDSVNREGGKVAVRFEPSQYSYEVSHWELLYRRSQNGDPVVVARISNTPWYVRGGGERGRFIIESAGPGDYAPEGRWLLEGAAPRLPKENISCRNSGGSTMECRKDFGREVKKRRGGETIKWRRAWPDYHSSPLLLNLPGAREGWYSIRSVEYSGLVSPSSNSVTLH